MMKLLLFLTIFVLSALSVTAQEQSAEASAPVKEKPSGPEGLKKTYVDTKMRAAKVGNEEPYRPSMRISLKYFEGEFLIYDCKSRHFACVDQPSFERCKTARKEGLDTKAERVLACAPLKMFSKFSDCAKEQYILQHRRLNKSMCLVELGAASN
ncbi:MAG: hypothetical protein A2X86_15920 [Bdellovibrionales bacterium GWA2_49_15]|nr:MAG: hypothetical protein A2X86_15920 [Bdellovibrionales bacterium GWA2_49_15]HAZ12425.1 hypothetical protein [Bdellovibrionales bacterium]